MSNSTAGGAMKKRRPPGESVATLHARNTVTSLINASALASHCRACDGQYGKGRCLSSDPAGRASVGDRVGDQGADRGRAKPTKPTAAAPKPAAPAGKQLVRLVEDRLNAMILIAAQLSHAIGPPLLGHYLLA